MTKKLIKYFGTLISDSEAVLGNFYRVLANSKLTNNNKQLQEEIIKAKEMFGDDGEFIPEWEEAFIKAERHKLFRGSILFFFSPKIGGPEAFLERFKIMETIFDENGITQEYRKNHILIRALISFLNQ